MDSSSTSSETVSNDSNGWATPTSGPPRPWAPMASPRSRLAPSGPHRCGSVRRSSRRTRADRRCWPNRSPDWHRRHPGVSCSASARPPTSSWSDGTESRSRSRFSRPATWSVSSRRRSAARRSPRPTTPLTSRASDSAWCLSSRYRFSWRRFARGCCAWRAEKATGPSSTGCRPTTLPPCRHRPGGKSRC